MNQRFVHGGESQMRPYQNQLQNHYEPMAAAAYGSPSPQKASVNAMRVSFINAGLKIAMHNNRATYIRVSQNGAKLRVKSQTVKPQ